MAAVEFLTPYANRGRDSARRRISGLQGHQAAERREVKSTLRGQIKRIPYGWAAIFVLTKRRFYHSMKSKRIL